AAVAPRAAVAAAGLGPRPTHVAAAGRPPAVDGRRRRRLGCGQVSQTIARPTGGSMGDVGRVDAHALVADAHGLVTVGHHDLGGRGDGMQVLREGDVLYVGHHGPSGAGTSILDASDPTDL